MEPLWGRETLARQGANADERNADERASQKGSEQQKHPRVGTRALLQQRDYVGGPRLLRRRVDLLRAQGQGQRHSALHLRDDRGPEDCRGRTVRKLAGGVERAQLRRISLPRTPVHNMVTSAARLLLSGPLRHGGADGGRGHDRVVGRATLKGITTEGQGDFARRPELWLAFVLDLAAMNKGRGRNGPINPV